ncbi:MAG: Gx transporter family protein [Magnetococcales bacterium]|nr:Gx transporter family protein [Magnetococcales bacterium]
MNEGATRLRRDLLVAYLAAAALAAHLLEAVAPGPGPWFKPGLANVFALVAYFRFGWRAAVSVTLIRVLAGSMVLGTLFSPTFFLSFCGAVGAMAAMGLAVLLPARLGPVGVSLLSALAHMLAQTIAAWLVVIGHAGILATLPLFLAGSWITGIMNGLLTFLLLERFDRHLRLLNGM